MRCFDCKFSVMLMFFCISRMYYIYSLFERGARLRLPVCGRALGPQGPSTVCFFNTCYSIYFIPANAFCDVMCILAVIIIIIRSLTVVF